MSDKKVTIVAGTFNKFHVGHEALINAALNTDNNVLIGVMTDDFAASTRDTVIPYDIRHKRVINYLLNCRADFNRISLVPMNDCMGDVDKHPEYDTIVVSEETAGSVDKLNEIREKAGLQPLKVKVIPIITDENGEKISSSNIMSGKIDKYGRYTHRLSATMLGTSGGQSSPERASAGIIVSFKNHNVLFDCGDLTSLQMMRAKVKVSDIHAIFISHAHIDHYIGLPMLIMHHMMLQCRTKPLSVYAPKMVIDAIKPMFDNYPIPAPFNVEFVELTDGFSMNISGMNIRAFKVSHSVENSFGFAVVSENSQKIVYSGDTGPCENTVLNARDANILFHEATFANSYAKELHGHSTIKDAIQVGIDAQVHRVILTHISLRYHTDMDLYRSDIPSNTIPVDVGEDLMRYTV